MTITQKNKKLEEKKKQNSDRFFLFLINFEVKIQEHYKEIKKKYKFK